MERPSNENCFSLEHSEERLVWIFGSSRSGSSWLLRMLSELDGAAPIDDPHLGHHLGVWRPIPLAWAAADQEPELTTLNDLKRHKPSYFFSDRHRDAWAPALRRLIIARFDAEVADAQGGEHASQSPLVIVKEPGSHVADLLMSLFPRSRMIFLVRDGRDVVDSWLDAHRADSWALPEGAFAVSVDGREALVRWQASVWAYRMEVVKRAYEAHRNDRKLMVRYETLLHDPQRELGRICGSFGVPIEDERLRVIANEHSYKSVPGAHKGDGKEIRAARPGAWREHLTPAEQRAMSEIMGPKLAELGYISPAVTQVA
jgi:Sulfotransferase family